MNGITAQKYLELISSLRTYIGQQHPKGSWIATDAPTYAYFLELASRMKPGAKQAPPPTAKPMLQMPAESIPQQRIDSNKTEKPVQRVQEPAVPPSPAIDKMALPLSDKPTPKEPAKPQPLSKSFMRDAPSTPTRPEFTEMRSFFEKQLPAVNLSSSILDDSAAKALASSWRAPPSEIVILSFSELAKEKAFIDNLAHALNQCVASTKVLFAKKIEDEKGWDKLLKDGKLRLVIASNYNLHTLPELLKHFHEDATGKHKIGHVKLYLLSDLSLYMQQPALKSSLWKTLSQLYR